MTSREDLILRFSRDRALAHEVLFRHRHPDTTPPFHRELIEWWHSRHPRVLAMAFREAAKSTIAEESLALAAEFKLFRNGIIVGSTEKRAVERLRAIKYEILTNEGLVELFGEQGGDAASIWNEAEIVLANGVRLLAVGRGQSLRGTKHLQWRPDFCFCDDIEEVEADQIYTTEMAEETLRWFLKVLIPALDKKNARVRVNATPLSRDALPMRLKADPDWITRVYPVEYKDEQGARRSTWPGRYPLVEIDRIKASFERAGMIHDYMQEYMCEAEDPAAKAFTADMIRVEAKVRTWHPVFMFYDPARTVKTTSATTGWAAWSWIGNRLIVWDGGGDLWKPDEITDHIFRMAALYSPVEVGIEEDGLNEFLMQPLRQEMVRRNFFLPLVPYRAPKQKLTFIRGLQPFFAAKEIIFAKDLPEMRRQFLSFPAGRIDGPNALAYAPRMRPGQLIYENFAAENVSERLPVLTNQTVFLALNATAAMTTAVACQFSHGSLYVLKDWVREGDPGAALPSIVKEAGAELGAKVKLVAGPAHYGQYDTVGLRGAVGKLPADLIRGGELNAGREELRTLMQLRVRGNPALQVSADAPWTVNAFCAGYAREIGKDGKVKTEAKPGLYRVLMEGIEVFTSLLKSGIMEDRSGLNVQRTASGRAYLSALPGQRAGVSDAKDDFLRADDVVNGSRLLRRG